MVALLSTDIDASTRTVVPEVKLLEPDVYGQRHPVETEQLLSFKLQELDQILTDTPIANKRSFLKAQRLCPDLLTKTFMLRFLRCDVFNAAKAAKRFIAYWQKRELLFGEKRAFQPLTLTSMDDEKDRVARQLCVFNIFETSDRVVAFNILRNYSLEGTTRESFVKVFWYLVEAALEHTETQKHGIVVLNCLEGVNISKQKDLQLVKTLGELKGCLPLRLSASHVVRPPSWLIIFIPFLRALLGERLRKRIIFQTGTQEAVLDNFARYGLPPHEVPTELGGELKVDMSDFFESRLAAGL